MLGDIASLREVWDDAAVYIDPRDDGELERALRRLIEDEPLSRELAEAAMARSRRYSPERTAEAYLSLYERLPQRVG